jgi:predicted TIM-barrel fold metal-dependent hydrolase
MWDEVDKYLVGLPVYFDTAFISGYLTPERAGDIIRRHGPDKILFGSDSPWRNQAEAIQFIKELPLSQEAQDKIFYQNAAGLLGLVLCKIKNCV